MKYLDVIQRNPDDVVSLAQLKEHLKITFSNDDSYIQDLGLAAQQRLEDFCNIFILETSLVQYGNTFNDLNILYKSPLLNDTFAVKYKSGGAWVDFTSSSELVWKLKPSRIYLKDNNSIPTTDDVFQAWKCEYKAGWNNVQAVPQPIIQAIKIMVADMYENRQSVIVGKIVSEIPRTAQYLMNPYKVQTL